MRVRPPSEAETNAGGKLCVDASDPSNVYLYDRYAYDDLLPLCVVTLFVVTLYYVDVCKSLV